MTPPRRRSSSTAVPLKWRVSWNGRDAGRAWPGAGLSGTRARRRGSLSSFRRSRIPHLVDGRCGDQINCRIPNAIARGPSARGGRDGLVRRQTISAVSRTIDRSLEKHHPHTDRSTGASQSRPERCRSRGCLAPSRSPSCPESRTPGWPARQSPPRLRCPSC